MTWLMAAAAALATINPLRVWSGVPGRSRGPRIQYAAAGAVIVVAVTALISGCSGPLLKALNISAPTARIAAGVALVVIGGRDMIVGPAHPPAAESRPSAKIVAIALQHLFAPGLAILAISAGADLGVLGAVTAIGVGLIGFMAVAAQPPPRRSHFVALVARAGHGVTGTAAALLGAALCANGVFDI